MVSKEQISQIKSFKEERIEKQYYVAKSDTEDLDLNALNEKTKKFHYDFVELINTITESEINHIREEIKAYSKLQK